MTTKQSVVDRLRRAQCHRIRTHFPAELIALDQWVVWRYLQRGDAKKPTKPPYDARSGGNASVDDPTTWCSFETACHAYLNGAYDGLGFIFTESDPYAGVDLDDCFHEGEMASWAADALAQLDSYSERSPTKTGAHVLVRGVLPEGLRKRDHYEMYDSARYFTVTGDHIGHTPKAIHNRQPQLTALHQEVFGAKEAQAKSKTESKTASKSSSSVDAYSDDELLEIMFGARNGEDIRRLWQGDISAYGNNQSRADQALCNHLAFYTHNDGARMDRLFRGSGLFREKWDKPARKGELYGQGTIDRAMAGTTTFYRGGRTPKVTNVGTRASTNHNGAAPPVDDDPVNGDEHDSDAPAGGHQHDNSHDDDKGDDARLLEWPVHDHGNAALVKLLHPDSFGFCDGLGWMHHTGSHWDTENAEQAVNRTITETLIRRRIAAVRAERDDVVKGTSPSTSRKNAVKDMFKDQVVVRLKDFDTDPNVLNCANGVVDLRNGQLVTHGPSDRFTYVVPTDYLPDSQSELWLNFLSESIGDYDKIASWLQMAFGYSITGRTNEECMFYCEGPTRSGKGTLARAKLALLGHPLAKAVDFATFTSARDGNSQNFDLAPLRAARVIVAAESGRYSSLNEAVVKNITGNDPITAAFKFHDPFTYEPQFKIWLSSNYPVKGDVDDDGFWGRLRVIRFPHSHLGNEDKTLKWRMADPENLPGILAWAVEGSRRWYASPQGLITPRAVEAATQKARDELDHVQSWLDECTEPNIGGGEANARLYNSYETWCEGNGYRPKEARGFGRALESKGYEACKVKLAGNSVRGRRNLRVIGNTSKDVDLDD